MAETRTARKGSRKSTDTRRTRQASATFTDDEKMAMKARVRELKNQDNADGETLIREKIDEMTPPDRAIAERLHALIKAGAPDLEPRLWYGMPAYAKDGKLVCHFQPAQKFKTRYATLGFSDKAALDEGNVWPVAFALTRLTAADEARIVALLRKAID
jgi:uncharacterized protein YdhG (YjbR/CyaY superfamily)